MEGKVKQMIFPVSNDNWSKQRKAGIGDKVIFSGRKNFPNRSGKFVTQHLNHTGSVLSHKRMMADTGLSTKHNYLLKCDMCVDADPAWVASSLFEKRNI
tara:strand:- start:188 stop:484 length:297 start_codon:yes stop_codon:yes gene_type:complete